MNYIYYSFGELWTGGEGSWRCEEEGCDGRSILLYITETEFDDLPDKSYPAFALVLVSQSIGRVLCCKHAPEITEELIKKKNREMRIDEEKKYAT